MSISKIVFICVALTSAQLASAKVIGGGVSQNPPAYKTLGQSVPPDPYGVLNGQSVPPDPYATMKHNPPGYDSVSARSLPHNSPMY